MKSFVALLLVACLAVSVYGQLPAAGGASRMNPALLAQALSRGGGSGLNNILALSALSGGMSDGLRDYYLCNSLFRGRGGMSNMLCLSQMMA